jgi:galactokinase
MKFRAPGRVNLIGEHTDYNDGYVLPVAIELETIATVRPAGEMRFSSTSNPPSGWESYVLGVEKQLRRRAVPIPNLDIEFSSTLPIGAGLSSSAALEVSAALAFIAASGFELPALEIAKLCQQAEIETVGLACGIMDQFISLHGRANHAILLDCRNLAWHPVAIPEGITLVIADTGVKHALASSEYNTRRKECEEAAVALGVQSLRDATHDGGYKRARHIISENARVLGFVEALAANDRKGLGELMAASHESLRIDYEVSCLELDAMVAAAQQCPGLIGARMTGGGFGGSTINLVETNEANDFAVRLAELYPGASIYVTKAANGAGPQNP